MLKNKFRILLIVLSFSTGILFYTQEEFLKAFLFIIAGCLFIYGYYRYSNIWLIFNHIKRNEFERAELLLNDIKSIEVLNSQSKAYYYFSKGIVEDNKNNLAEAEKNYLNSLKYNLRTENDKSIINLNLANIYFRKKNV